MSPTISLMGHNIGQISLIYIVRPLIVSIFLAILLLLLVNLVIKDWSKTGIIVTPMIIAFSIFGILFDKIQNKVFFGINLNHRFGLALVFGFVLAAITIYVVTRKSSFKLVVQVITIVGLTAVLIPAYQLISYQLTSNISTGPVEMDPDIEKTTSVQGTDYPDIYYFILDGYSRSDVLKSSFKLDNSAFLDELKKLGFYVADCSRSNYVNTRLSLTSSLNMDYLNIVAPEATPDIQRISAVDKYVQNNKVFSDLEALGYKSVSFQTGYLFSEIHNADYYIRTSEFSFTRPFVTPFESLLLDETGFRLLQAIPAVQMWSIKSPLYERYLIDKNKIEMVQNLNLPSPKFVFVHLTPAHRPYMFTPGGDLQSDDRYYSKDKGWPISQGFGRKGYVNGIMYLNDRMIPIIKKLQSSDNPPIIIIQGDHGNMVLKQSEILNAYYFPDLNYSSLYPSISPVNSFRVIFNQVFNGSLPLLPDRSYTSSLLVNPFVLTEIQESSPACVGD